MVLHWKVNTFEPKQHNLFEDGVFISFTNELIATAINPRVLFGKEKHTATSQDWIECIFLSKKHWHSLPNSQQQQYTEKTCNEAMVIYIWWLFKVCNIAFNKFVVINHNFHFNDKVPKLLEYFVRGRIHLFTGLYYFAGIVFSPGNSKSFMENVLPWIRQNIKHMEHQAGLLF